MAKSQCFVAATEIRVGRGTSCRYGRSRRAILHRHDDCAASIPKFGLEIKNRCTKEGENGGKLAVIPKFGPEIKNRCTKGKRIRGFERLPSHSHRESAGGVPAYTKKIPGDVVLGYVLIYYNVCVGVISGCGEP